MKYELTKIFKRTLASSNELITQLGKNQQVNPSYLPQAQQILSNYQRQEEFTKLGLTSANLLEKFMENNRKNEEIITPQQNNWNLNLQVTPQLWPINNYSVREFVGEKIERDSLSNKNKKQEKPRKTIEKILFANQLSKIILELKIRIFD